jgi:hypothetical protein
VDLDVHGTYAYARSLKKGQTVVKVRNPYCANELEITIIVGYRFIIENSGEGYIYSNKVISEYKMNGSSEIISYEIRNETEENKVDYNWAVFGDSVTLDFGVKDKIYVKPVITGMTHARLKNKDGSVFLDFYFIVRNNEESRSIYLTTNENYIIMGMNEIRYTDIRLEGYNEIDSGRFKWEIDNRNVAQVSGNGTRGQISPVGEGNAVITVTHPEAVSMPLKIYLKVNKNSGEKAVYLTTPTNIIEAVVSENLNYIYVQKMGGDVTRRNCTWTVDDPSVVSISGNEYTGMYLAKKAGIAQITVRNVETEMIPLNIVVIVRDSLGGDKYITTNENLIMMKPGVTNRRVEVYLEGGEESDNNKFSWMIYSQTPSDVNVAINNGNVISISSNGNLCNINSINDGVARIRVTNMRADNPLYITVYVSRYNTVEFDVDKKEMQKGTSEFIVVKTPIS